MQTAQRALADAGPQPFLRALRPFSLIVAFATCSLGALLAHLDGDAPLTRVALVVVAGLLLQSGANLINDHADLGRLDLPAPTRRSIRHNARWGVLAIACACAIGLWFVYLRGWPMALLGSVGVFGVWAYAAGPVELKSRGLGLPAVFLLTGVLMVEGAYYAVCGRFSFAVAYCSLPFSFFAVLLLLANELRDYESDRLSQHKTFTVRFGLSSGGLLYRRVAIGVALATLGLIYLGYGLELVLPLLALSLLLMPFSRLSGSPQKRAPLALLTGRAYFAFALCFVVSVWIGAQ